MNHGYAGYSNGCRCQTCTGAKAGYMRSRRAAAHPGSTGKSSEDFTHGTRFGYEERGCRCTDCTTARRTRGTPRPQASRRRCRGCGYVLRLCCCPGGPRGGKSS